VTYTRCRIDTINSPDDGHIAARNMWRIEISIHGKRIVRQVGYLQGLYRDAWSTEHKILLDALFTQQCKFNSLATL